MRALIFACRLEADFFIEKFAFKQVSEKPFATFANDGANIFISGIGPLAASLCARHVLDAGASEILNAGACGDLKNAHAIGTVLDVSKILSRDPYCSETFDLGREGATLITSSSPVSSDARRMECAKRADIVDMEAYGIMSALRLGGFDFAKVSFKKFVSDFSGACDIEKNIEKHISVLEPHVSAWLNGR